MIVWGGYQDTGIGHPLTFLKNGGRYDPTTHTWAPLSTTGAPDARSLHTAVWAGDRMIVWGGEVKTPIYDDGIIVGYTTERLGGGGAYDPATDSWTPLSLTDAPVGRRYTPRSGPGPR